MKIKFIDRNINAPKKSIKIKRSGDVIKVIRNGFGEENAGKKITTAYCGDIIRFPPEITGHNLWTAAWAWTEPAYENWAWAVPAYEGSEHAFTLYKKTEGIIELPIVPGESERIRLRIEYPKVPEIKGPYIGPGAYGAPAGWGRLKRKTSMRRWIDECIASGKNGMRVIPLSYAWDKALPECLISHNEDWIFNLEYLQPDTAARFLGDLWHARRNGLMIAIDIFDQIGLKYPRYLNNPLHADNNIHGEIIPWKLFEGTENAPPCEMGKMSFDNKFERILKKLCGTEKLFELYMKYARNLSGLYYYEYEFPIFFSGNELETRTGERNMIGLIDGINGSYLWGETSGTIPQHVIDDFDLFGNIDYIRLHSCSHLTVAQKYAYVLPLLNRWEHLMVYFDSDGVGSGSVRGQNGRMTFAQESEAIEKAMNLAGDRFAGWFGKTLSIPDTSEWIKEVKR